jgi:hypothetical protein
MPHVKEELQECAQISSYCVVSFRAESKQLLKAQLVCNAV